MLQRRMFVMLEELEDSPEAVAARLERVRNILELSKRDFALKAGLTEQAYGQFENATRPLSLAAAKKIRKTYALPLEFMYFGKSDDLPHRIAKAL